VYWIGEVGFWVGEEVGFLVGKEVGFWVGEEVGFWVGAGTSASERLGVIVGQTSGHVDSHSNMNVYLAVPVGKAGSGASHEHSGISAMLPIPEVKLGSEAQISTIVDLFFLPQTATKGSLVQVALTF
jgi:hypothetical protein